MEHTRHPLWEQQVALEYGMARDGARRVQDAVDKAIGRGQKSRLRPYEDLMQAWVPKAAEDLQRWVKQSKLARGVKPMALEPLADLDDPYVCVYLGLRQLLEKLSTRNIAVASVAASIGKAVEHETMVRQWEDQSKEWDKRDGLRFGATRNRLRDQHADHKHTHRVNINTFNMLLERGSLAWKRWEDGLQIQVGITILNSIMRSTGWFEVVDGMDPGKPDQRSIILKPGMERWLLERLQKMEECSPALKPTIMAPKRWSGMSDGGYWTPACKGPQLWLIRFHAHQKQQQQNAYDEYNSLDMPSVYDALNFLQETPWRINRRVHTAIHEALRRNVHCDGALTPEYRMRDMPPRPIKATPENIKAWRREASRVHSHNSLLVSKRLMFDRTLGVAHEFEGYDRFYFPHFLDFRGRMYAIPVGLQPQGNDVSRGLLEFAEGRAITKENKGDEWLAINLASAWGNDKISFAERVAWVRSNTRLWRDVARNPIGTARRWATVADKPWQALAAVYDWCGFLDEGYGYVSHAAVAVDGTCNGLQHFAALSRDPEVGRRVNLVPGRSPEDIYQYVADAIMPELLRLSAAENEEGDYARFWLSKADARGKLPRKLVKQSVMVLAYSATRDAFARYAFEWLGENDPITATDKQEAYRQRVQQGKRVNFFVKLLMDACNAALPGPMAVMRWLKACAKEAALGNQPIFWRTPDGFIVRHFYGKMREFRVTAKLDGSVFKLRLEEPTKDLDTHRQLLGISPNFVHSYDACAARGCINRVASEGTITAFHSIHDSFGTHAANMGLLNEHLRAAFVEAHESNPLLVFRNACLTVMRDRMIAEGKDYLEASQIADEKLPPLPELGGLDIQGVLESTYFFA